MRLNRKHTILTAILTLLLYNITFSQNIINSRDYPQGFRPPLDLKPTLAGCFGEIRANHFHSGLDYRTNQREGYPIYAVADGYISRLRVQTSGFGNAIYISHPSGYTSVYAHLQRFNKRVGQTVKDFQYRKESFEIDFPLLPVEIPVKKGDIIAWSGNTGSSGGPHLHFEMRDSKTEETINPQLFGFNIPDNVKPTLSGLYMYNLDGLPFSESTRSQYFPLSGGNGNYVLTKPIIRSGSEVGFGIVAFDQQLAGGNKNGVYSIELFLDDKPIYTSVLERFAFADSKAINSYVDYPGLMAYRRTVQKSFIDPGNPLGVYRETSNRGIVDLSDDLVHQLKYIVKDFKGNTSYLTLKVQGNADAAPAVYASGIKTFPYSDSTEFRNQKVRISVPKGALYNDLDLKYSNSPRPQGSFSIIHNVHTPLIPVHTYFNLWIKPDVSIPENLKDKAVIISTKGVSQGGIFEDGYVKARPRVFGSFYIKLDTIAPSIRPVNISDGKSMTGINKVMFKISDNLSGIHSYRGTIDGSWVLFAFDQKTATLSHIFEDELSSGSHSLQIQATDMKMNTRTYTATFYK